MLLIAMASFDAQAATLTNLDTQAHVVEIKTPGGTRLQEIRPGETFRAVGDITVRFDGYETRIEEKMEFAIWKGGVLGPQKMRNKGL